VIDLVYRGINLVLVWLTTANNWIIQEAQLPPTNSKSAMHSFVFKINDCYHSTYTAYYYADVMKNNICEWKTNNKLSNTHQTEDTQTQADHFGCHGMHWQVSDLSIIQLWRASANRRFQSPHSCSMRMFLRKQNWAKMKPTTLI